MKINEYEWFKNNFDNLTENEQIKCIKLGIKEWIESKEGKINVDTYEFIRGMKYLDRLYKKYKNIIKIKL